MKRTLSLAVAVLVASSPLGAQTTYNRIGNVTYGSDGTSYNRVGSTTYGSDGSTYNRVGSTTYGSDGTTYNRVGNTTYGSDGSTASRVGNSTFINAPGGTSTCTTTGNITTCN